MAAGSELILQVNKPAAGEVSELRVNSLAASRVLLSLDFEPSEALSELVEDDLVFKFDDDAELVLRGCFAGEDANYPNFVLTDGSELDGGELYAVLSGSVKLFPEDDGPVGSVAPLGPVVSDAPLAMGAEGQVPHLLEAMQAQPFTGHAANPAGGQAAGFNAALIAAGSPAGLEDDLSLLVQTIIGNSGVS